MGIRARDQACIQHAWQHLISCITRTPGHFVRSILAWERCANQNRLRLLLRSLHHKEMFLLLYRNSRYRSEDLRFVRLPVNSSIVNSCAEATSLNTPGLMLQ